MQAYSAICSHGWKKLPISGFPPREPGLSLLQGTEAKQIAAKTVRDEKTIQKGKGAIEGGIVEKDLSRRKSDKATD